MDRSSSSKQGRLGKAERRWRAAVCLGWPLAMGAAPVLTALGDVQLCAFRQLSGRPCPLCGGTHACAALVEGDVSAAWQANPGVVPLLALASVHTVQLAYEALSGCRIENRRAWKSAWIAGGAFLLAAWGLRLLELV
jgi:hypothetical protein